MSTPLFDQVLQIGIVVKNARATAHRYSELLGLSDWHFNEVDTPGGKGRNFTRAGEPITAQASIAWLSLGNVELELIQPKDENSAYAEFLSEHGQGIHHVMLATTHYDDCANQLTDQGISILGSGELQNTRFQLFDTQKDLGMIIEIAEGDALKPDTSGLD